MKINRSSPTSVYMQVYASIRRDILKGVIRKNDLLPSERHLARQLDVNRSTITLAYDLLKSDGLIASSTGKGTFVTYEVITPEVKTKTTYYAWAEKREAKKGNKNDTIIQTIMDANKREESNFLAGGLPNDSLIPNKIFGELAMDLLSAKHINVLSHCPIAGLNELRKQIKSILGVHENQISIDRIMVTSGSQQALDLVFKAYLAPGDVVIVEEPTFFGALQLLKHYQAKIVTVPMEMDGMNTKILEFMIQKHKPKMIYTIPNFHNPTGITMSLSKRKKLVEISNHYNIPIIEDDPYGTIRYTGSSLPNLYTLDSSNHVIYTGTFSKTVALGIRVGYIIAPKEIIPTLEKMKQITDLHVNTLNQYILTRFIEEGHYFKHLKTINEVYFNKMSLMIKTLNEGFPDIELTMPEGGYYLWVKLEDKIPINELYKLCSKAGTLFTPGYHFLPEGKPSCNFIRLNFTYPSNESIVNGIHTIQQYYLKLKEKKL